MGVVGHHPAVYLNWMESYASLTQSQIEAFSAESKAAGVVPWILSFRCPVAVTVYDDQENVLAFESEEENTRGGSPPSVEEDSDVVSWITEEGAKCFFIPYYSGADYMEVVAGAVTGTAVKLLRKTTGKHGL